MELPRNALSRSDQTRREAAATAVRSGSAAPLLRVEVPPPQKTAFGAPHNEAICGGAIQPGDASWSQVPNRSAVALEADPHLWKSRPAHPHSICRVARGRPVGRWRQGSIVKAKHGPGKLALVVFERPFCPSKGETALPDRA